MGRRDGADLNAGKAMSKARKILAVTFDVGGTLISPWPSVGHVYAGVATKHGHHGISPDLLNERFAAAWRGLEQFHHGRDEWAALVDRVFEGLTDPPPSSSFFPEIFTRFGEPEAWRIFDDVKPAIDALASLGINLAVISNWDDRLQPLLERLGLRKYFETIVISCETGFPKPSPVIFEHAARKLGLAPEFILHVGDSERDDLQGAEEAGFQARLIERSKSGAGPGRINSLLELEHIAAGAR
jgi:putative hydrolase of the HAD superfamily